MGTQKNRLNEHPNHMQNIMGKKIFTILRWNLLFCLSKPLPVYEAISLCCQANQPIREHKAGKHGLWNRQQNSRGSFLYDAVRHHTGAGDRWSTRTAWEDRISTAGVGELISFTQEWKGQYQSIYRFCCFGEWIFMFPGLHIRGGSYALTTV